MKMRLLLLRSLYVRGNVVEIMTVRKDDVMDWTYDTIALSNCSVMNSSYEELGTMQNSHVR